MFSENNILSLDQLRTLIRNISRPDITSVQSLISKIIGNRNATIMAMQLLHWFPHATCDGGWVYKSWRDWHAECDLSQGQIKRVHSGGFLEQIGIQRTVMKAWGVPTNHYRLDMDVLAKCIANYLSQPVQQIYDWMNDPMESVNTDQSIGADQPNPMDQNDQIESANTTQSITQETTKQSSDKQTEQQTQEAVVLSLTDLGISKQKAMDLLKSHGEESVLSALDHATAPNVRNPAGCLIASLSEGWNLASLGEKRESAIDDGRRYITGQYSDWIRY